MKKAVAVVLAVMMVLVLSVSAFAARGPLTLEEAKQAALEYAGVKASEATFTKAHRDFDDGREVYEIEFYANGTEYEMDVDASTGRILEFSTEYHRGTNMRSPYGNGRYYDDDMYDRDYDLDDFFDWD